MRDVFNWLRHSKALTDAEKKWIKDNDFGVSVVRRAIPRKGPDVLNGRVRTILNKKYGNHIIENLWDLAVSHQRDFDADHLYVDTDLPMDVIRENQYINGMIKDVTQIPRTFTELNPFGRDMGPNAGNEAGLSSGTGRLSEYKAGMQMKQMAIGTFIGVNKTLAWLSNVNLEILPTADGALAAGAKFDFVPNRKNILERAGLMEMQQNIIQANVDMFKGQPDMFIELQGKVIEFMLFGDNMDNIKIPEQYHNFEPLFDFKSATKSYEPQIYKDAIMSILRTVKRADMMFNDVYENGMQRNLTAYDVRLQSGKLNEIFDNKTINLTVFKNLFWKYRYANNGRPDHRMQAELIRLFTTDGHRKGMNEEKLIREFKEDIMKGREWEGYIKQVFKFNDGAQTTAEKRVKSSPAGYIINKLRNGKNGVNPFDRDNTQKFGKNVITRDSAVADMDNVMTRMSMLRALGTTPEEMLDFDPMDPSKETFMGQFRKPLMGYEVRQQQTRNIISTVLDNRSRDIHRKLEFLAGNRNSNKFQIDDLTQELSTVALMQEMIESYSMASLGVQVQEGMKTKIFSNGKNGRYFKNTSYQNMAIYEVANRVDLTNKKDVAKEFAKVTKGEKGNRVVKFHGSLRAGDSIKTHPGKKYIVVERPLVEKQLSEKDVIDGYAWMWATEDANFEWVDAGNQFRLRDDITEVTGNITTSMKNRRQKLIDSPQYSKEIHGIDAVKEQNDLTNLFKKWAIEEQPQLDVFSGQESHRWDYEKVRQLSMILMSPHSVAGTTVAANKNVIPHFRSNVRLQKALFTFLKNEGMLDVVGDRIKFYSDMVEYIKNGVDPKDMDLPNRAEIGRTGSKYWEHLEKFGGDREFVHDLLQDQFGYTNIPLLELLSKRGLIYRSDPQKAQIFGERVIPEQVSYYNIGTLRPKSNGGVANLGKQRFYCW